jgi:hypothetical protein
MTLTPEEYDRFITSPFVDESIATADGVQLVVVVGGDAEAIEPPGSKPVVVAWLGAELGGHGPGEADLVVGPEEIDHLVDLTERCPLAATTLVVLLRSVAEVPVDEALALESAAYSLLQGGPEFAAWRRGVEPQRIIDDASVVRTSRHDGELVVELDRPTRHNAVTAQLRDELHAALAIALADPSIERVVLRGIGPSFCSGGDLTEFGSRADPVAAHRIRLARSPARDLHQLADRLSVLVHGATLGGGLEMSAFARRVVAHPATRLGLPEVGLGLIPGAGGTVSITRRIGRQRTAAIALAVDTIDAPAALAWGLVDEIDDTWAG